MASRVFRHLYPPVEQPDFAFPVEFAGRRIQRIEVRQCRRWWYDPGAPMRTLRLDDNYCDASGREGYTAWLSVARRDSPEARASLQRDIGAIVRRAALPVDSARGPPEWEELPYWRRMAIPRALVRPQPFVTFAQSVIRESAPYLQAAEIHVAYESLPEHPVPPPRPRIEELLRNTI